MRTMLAVVTFSVFLCFCQARAGDAAVGAKAPLAAVAKADDARIAAMKVGDREALRAVLADDLHYAHSTGEVDSKTSLIAKLTSGKTKYAMMDYEKRDFTVAAPDIALMSGRVHIRAVTGENTTDAVLSFLGVWRLEKGEWRFLAWQSCKLPAK